ncbi:anaerobic ribonucleoside-triphosphate reductase [uncultured Selenomonas sp.]|uniref:anaerobic ribonucleoside-triphosphate reductase n=1 Tax=uncultured Selenomonas sp. TaxID=159275 RepID=UPI002601240B|nr:anaerobic ribonucleoside-triphosphate reductase [uncultured Selenomonas sp.]
MLVNGTEVTVKGIPEMSEKEITNYISYVADKTQEPVDRISIVCRPDGTVSLDYQLRPQKFERIRRITGYLVGTIDRWNDAKRAEEHDRVKHGLH